MQERHDDDLVTVSKTSRILPKEYVIKGSVRKYILKHIGMNITQHSKWKHICFETC